MILSTRVVPNHLTLTAVRFEVRNSSNGAPPPENGNPTLLPAPRRPVLSISKPSWIVRTESNVRLEKRRKPDPPCVVCKGCGKVDCHRCCGTGRSNSVDLAMLPKGEWPKWCRTCGGSGLRYCARCFGTGEFRHPMGFALIKQARDQDRGNHEVPDTLRTHKSAAESFLGDE